LGEDQNPQVEKRYLGHPAARADYLITGNQRHFPKFWKKTKIISSRELIGIVGPHLLS